MLPLMRILGGNFMFTVHQDLTTHMWAGSSRLPWLRTSPPFDPVPILLITCFPNRYPVIYSILILPLSIVRWIGFAQESGGKESHISAAATMAVISIYGLSGACNVILLLITRPNSILFGNGVDYAPRRGTPGLAIYKSSSINVAVGEQTHDLGRLPSRSSAGWT